MRSQFISLPKPFITVWTRVLFLFCVPLHVFTQLMFFAKAFVAVCAHVRFVVGSDVLTEVSLIYKSLAAYRALETSLVRSFSSFCPTVVHEKVVLQVVFQFLQRKTFAAEGAIVASFLVGRFGFNWLLAR